MALAYHEQLQQPVHQQLDAHKLVAHRIQTEQQSRQQEKSVYFLRLAMATLACYSRTGNLFTLSKPYQATTAYLTAAAVSEGRRRYTNNKFNGLW